MGTSLVFCLALLLQNSEVEVTADSLRPEYFQRLENREIFSQLTRRNRDEYDGALVESLKAGIDQELA